MRHTLRACLAALLVLLLAAGCAAAEAPDFSGMTLEQLYEVRAQLEARIEELEAEEAVYYDDGRYFVGRDLPEGDYALTEREDSLFASVAVRRDESADGEVILYKLVNRSAVIRLEKNTWVTFMDLRAWPLGSEPESVREDGSVGEGGYLVGTQIPAGNYTLAPDEWAPLSSYSVYSGILGTGAKQIALEVLRGAKEMSLADGDYIELSGCTLTPAGE